MPQFDISSFIVQLIWLFFCFLTFYFLYTWKYLPSWAFLLKLRKKFLMISQVKDTSPEKTNTKFTINTCRLTTKSVNPIYF